jgi:hypothetical protein
VFSLIFILTSSIYAAELDDLSDAPPPLTDVAGVWMDIQNAQYHLQFDSAAKETRVTSTLEVLQGQAGHLLFDLVPNPTEVRLDGNLCTAEEIETPDRETRLRRIGCASPPGRHRLEISHVLKTGVSYGTKGAKAFFSLYDLRDREYLEQYLPTNFEYDHYPSAWTVVVPNPENYDWMTNAVVAENRGGTLHFEFPSHFTASSPFFHLFPKGSYSIRRGSYRSADGREIPITAYGSGSNELNSFLSRAKDQMAKLEAKFGPWPHPQFTAYRLTGSGSMEYSGATLSRLSALRHEMVHSYFARGVMPQDGNSGWIDEAIAAWHDSGYKKLSRVGFCQSRIGGHSPYRRWVNRPAYTQGRDLMAYLHHHLPEGLFPFLKKILSEYFGKNFSTERLITQLESFSGARPWRSFLEPRIYGTDAPDCRTGTLGAQTSRQASGSSSVHGPLSPRDLRDLLGH